MSQLTLPTLFIVAYFRHVPCLIVGCDKRKVISKEDCCWVSWVDPAL